MTDIDDALARSVIDHMNTDHPDAILDYLRTLDPVPPARAARIVAMDSRGIDVEWTGDNHSARVRLDFESPVRDAAGARRELVAMVKRARGE